MSKYGKITAALLGVWFVTVFWASEAHAFTNQTRLGPSVAVAALVPMIVFSLWFSVSNGFRSFALALNAKAITGVQVFRIMGFTFVLLAARNLLPNIFALSAGYGDMFIGATAGFAAWKLAEPARRGSFIFWQALGILDLVTAVSLGTTAGMLEPHGPSMAAITVLPLSLIPTFFVPLFMMLHIVCIAQAKRWRSTSRDGRQAVTPIVQPAG